MIKFIPWPKIPRLSNEKCIYTEKIDGTNACVVIDYYGTIGAQSRNRLITPQADNYGFATWVQANKQDLLTLGPGHHFGEWWGLGIGRKYNQTEKHFSLFNTHRWNHTNTPPCCSIVPIINTDNLELALEKLTTEGSIAAPGFMFPEGIIQFNLLTQTYYKIIIDK